MMSQQNKQLSASLEDYLEAIYNIIAEKGGVRAKDIAEYLNVKAGSVTTALQALVKSGCVNYKPYAIITLTPKGQEQAKKVTRKHRVLKDFFTKILGADMKISETGACQIEHVIPDTILKRLVLFTTYIQKDSECGSEMIKNFHGYLKNIAGLSVQNNTGDSQETLAYN